MAGAGLLTVIRPAVTMPVPDPTLYPGPPLFSRHAKFNGEHFVTAHYERLPGESRRRSGRRVVCKPPAKRTKSRDATVSRDNQTAKAHVITNTLGRPAIIL